ncbi:MAG: hypothetical protein A2275_04375 [Bacteroidetes bacterium RIFOXYA12_FULL_35_11]|nr:MAG: hypothetical protein A2X01_07845 [Bacteroidetes bacterium GWF2_35_48]OFY75547.1 MAG: hypothetical protein A2275_04375 [Bacteroidetes bacterium RIFOXYA12_FULL_35_11]OFY92296.1 MAG: hypothetical protein A2309_12545 [Bacteroidetes bacterium RIFOXYB2_FULL_35_7]OFY93034.1 MAG: hypothetical protein A2491_01790 [Bacteroidetes bacterium RIFOXYC12_FULL_35_7]HBX49818.1 hypothetical protein [Bacteroidales bacterium]
MWNKLLNNFSIFEKKDAFVIQERHYSYAEVRQLAASMQYYILSLKTQNKTIGIYLNNDITTYCLMIASLCSDFCYVPLNPANPAERNLNIIDQAEIDVIFYSHLDAEMEIIQTSLKDKIIFKNASQFSLSSSELRVFETSLNKNAYILFTSGSTGIPKGVPITHKNLFAFINAFYALNINIDSSDRFLQMFDLTFDLSVISYLIPLFVGASVHTVSDNGMKYMQVYSVLEDEEITFAMMVPSMLSYLRPYFEDLKFEMLRYSFFCGEALYEDIIKEWAVCVPNAHIINIYGPTEGTVVCMAYECTPGITATKIYNGIISIGKAMQGTKLLIKKEDGTIAKPNEKGELCLSGPQITAGYLKNEEKNKEVFFFENNERYYKTGDICFIDSEGDFFYCGRTDHQVKIDGYRIELCEVEHHVRECCNHQGVVVLDRKNEKGSMFLHLFLENYLGNTEELSIALQAKLPDYMIPKVITNLASFPLNSNGKVDRKALRRMM